MNKKRIPSHSEAPLKLRLDRLMVEQNLTETRSKARDLIKAGHVSVDGEVVKKTGQSWAPSAVITVSSNAPDFVSRSAVKLVHALKEFDIAVKDQTVLDIGASTGGFTEVLLRNGAAHIYAVDVGHDQLHETLRRDPSITSMEGRDARTLVAKDFKVMPTLITADVSFISLSKAVEQAIKLLNPGSNFIGLIKPQFEVTRQDLNKKGVVKNQTTWQQAVDKTVAWFEALRNWHVLGISPSPIKGHAGNHEVLIWAGKEDD